MKRYLIPFLVSFFTFNIFFGIYALDNEFFQKGLSYYQTSEYQLAIAHFKEAKTLEPNNPLNYFYLGNSYFQLNDLDNAILNYTTGLNFTEENIHEKPVVVDLEKIQISYQKNEEGEYEEAEYLEGGGGEITFYPKGDSTGGRVVLGMEGVKLAFQVDIEPVTGRVKVKRKNEEE